MNKKFFSYALLAILVLLMSCGSQKDVVYFQKVESQYDMERDSSIYSIRIKPNDNLMITVSALNPQSVEAFNVIHFDKGAISAQTLEWQGYLVDSDGNINFPLIGTIHLGDLTKSDAIKLLQKEVSKYADDPVVNIRFMNYHISVLGEVAKPGDYMFNDEKVTIPQAIAMAGDLTIYGERKTVLVCREENGKKEFHRINLTSPDVFMSPYYYLQQGDIVYIQPNGTKAGSSTYNQNLPLVVSLISVLITAIALVTRL